MSLLRAAKSSFWFKYNSLIYLIPNFKIILCISHTKIYHFTSYRKENKDNFTDNPRLRASMWETELGKLLKKRGQYSSSFSTYTCSQRIQGISALLFIERLAPNLPVDPVPTTQLCHSKSHTFLVSYHIMLWLSIHKTCAGSDLEQW